MPADQLFTGTQSDDEPAARPLATAAVRRETRSLLFLTNQLPSYRASTFLALERRVGTLTLLASGSAIAPNFRQTSLSIRTLDSPRLRLRRHHPTGYSEPYELHVPIGLFRELWRCRPDAIVAAEMGLRTAFAGLYRRLIDRKCVFVVHADLSEHTELGRGVLRQVWRRLLVRLADGIVVNGESGKRYVRSLGVPQRRIHLFPYATDVALFGPTRAIPSQDGVLRLLYVGRVIELKGLEPFVELLASAVRRRPDRTIEMTVAGDGDRREALAAMALPPNLRLVFRGRVPYEKLPETYGAADVFVMPSLGDTWGLVVNEAMACGLPIIGSNRSQAVAELVRPAKGCGWQFDPHDPASVGDAIEALLDTPTAELAMMGERARTISLQLTPDAVAEKLLDAIDIARRASASDAYDT